jgi:hypothetical protein
MKRQIVSCAFVVSLLFSIGCYSTEVVMKEELKAKAEQMDITVVTKDSLKYEFSKKRYRVQGDTLIGWSRVLTAPSSTSLSFQETVALLESGHSISANTYTRDSVVTSIALADITSLKTDQFDLAGTIICVILASSVLFIGFLYLILVPSIE